jgi:H+/Cl- antiporter ClcA
MKHHKYHLEQFVIALQLLRLTAIIIPISIFIGLLVALFLWLLEFVTNTRWQYPWFIYLLPLAGIFIYWLYSSFGKNASAGNNLILNEIHQPNSGIPVQMAPLILLTTVITHLVGGSAGREGTAVQIGGSISSFFAKWIKLQKNDTRIILLCGIAAGFGAVFGTPITGAIFALEVLTIGKIKYDALVPCLIASIVADITCASTGISHTQYIISYIPNGISYFHSTLNAVMLLKVAFAGILFGLTSYLFSQLSHFIKNKVTVQIKKQWLIPILGSALILGISYLLGTNDYMGLGVESENSNGISIVNAFQHQNIDPLSWFWKLLLTAITLGMGFKGGEVTPLFFIGATLGNTLAVISGSPIDLFAGLGFIAVFAGATNTPLACTIMGIELFGAENALYFAIACFTAYYFSGHSGIYQSQRVAVSKFQNSSQDTINHD